MTKRLYRSPSQKMIGGVCFGLAEYLDIDATIVRLIFVVLAMITAVFPMFLFYMIAWIIIPLEEDTAAVDEPPAAKSKAASTKTKSSPPSSAKKKS